MNGSTNGSGTWGRLALAAVVMAGLCGPGALPASAGGLPVTGMPIPELQQFDDYMVQFMNDNGIPAGLLAIMRDGEVIYQRGFGWHDEAQTIPIRSDAIMRIASITKPFTATAIRDMIADPGINLALNDTVFNLGQPGGGILPYSAFDGSQFLQWPSLPTPDMTLVTVQQILDHTSGLPPNTGGDPMFQSVAIADAFTAAGYTADYPASRVRTTQFSLGGPLATTPGAQETSPPASCADRVYSNFAYMVLGQVVEARTGQNYIDVIRQRVVAPIPWLPLNEVVYGRTFAADQDPREPWYDSNGDLWTNVFDPSGDPVPSAYGGYYHELHFASGGLVTTTSALVKVANTYYIQLQDFCDAVMGDYGLPTNGVPPASRRTHGGRNRGTSSMLAQRSDGINFAYIFNKRLGDSVFNDPRDNIDSMIDTLVSMAGAGTFTWPTQGVDGQWVQFGNGRGSGEGSFENPWSNMDVALASSPQEATVNFRPGTSNWTGDINQVIRMRAPLGPVSIGE